MDLADELLEAGTIGYGGVVVADHQTAGQGTHGREWYDTAGTSLLVTLVLSPEDADGLLPLRMGLAVMDVLAGFELQSLRLKWPNDCLCDDRKIAGTLCRAGTSRVAVGIGVNVFDHPHMSGEDDLQAGRGPEVSTSLAEQLRRLGATENRKVCPPPRDLLPELLTRCAERLHSARIRGECERRLWRLGEHVTVERPDGSTVRGRLTGLDDAGGLRIGSAHGVETVYAGRLRSVDYGDM